MIFLAQNFHAVAVSSPGWSGQRENKFSFPAPITVYAFSQTRAAKKLGPFGQFEIPAGCSPCRFALPSWRANPLLSDSAERQLRLRGSDIVLEPLISDGA